MMLRVVKTLSAQRLDHRHKAISAISKQRGPDVGRYILNRVCVKTWGDSPCLYQQRERHRRAFIVRMKRKAEEAPLDNLWFGTRPDDFSRSTDGGTHAI